MGRSGVGEAGAVTALTIAQGAAFAVTGVSLTVGPLALMRHGHGALGGALVAVLGLASGLGAALGGRGMRRRPGAWLAAGHALYGCAGGLALGSCAVGSTAGVVAAVWLIGMGQGIALLGRAVVASMALAPARGRVTGRMLAAGAVGAVAGPLCVEIVRAGAGATGGDPLTAPWILVCLLGLIGVATVRRAGALPARAAAERSAPARPAALSSRSAIVALAATQATMAGAMAIGPGRIHEMSGAATVMSIAVAVHLAAMYGAAPLVGRFVDRRGQGAAVAAGAALSVAGAVLVGAPSAGVAAAGLALVGVGWSAAYVVSTASLAGADRAGVLGLAELAAAAAAAMAAVAAALAVTAVAPPAVSLALAIPALVALIAAMPVRAPAPRPVATANAT